MEIRGGGGGMGFGGDCYQGHGYARSLEIFKFSILKMMKRTEHENLVISLSICMETHKLTRSSPPAP